MRLPYNQVHVGADVLFAARGGCIYSFSLDDGSFLSQWQHPDTHKADGEADAEHPAKRPRLDSPSPSPRHADKTEEPPLELRQKAKKNKREAIATTPDRPIIIHITSTTDGAHVLAVSGHDKTIWVFANDASGQLRQLSSRTMPKRPSSVLICPDDATILSADKFGDVYSLPLIPSSSSSSSSSLSLSSSKPSKPKPKQPSASALTVHSKANLNALNNQLRALAAEKSTTTAAAATTATAGSAGDDNGTHAPAFEHALQLGHVSMLTAMALGETDGPTGAKRRYIITADRDEHIRLSRFMPHAHVIEGYCMGHGEFVSAMAIPPGKPEMLISGGGDPELHVWDWVGGRLVQKADVLGRLKEAGFARVDKVAVVALLAVTTRSSDGDMTWHVLAILEGVPALLHWKVAEGNKLSYTTSISLPGNPLHMTSQSCLKGDSKRVLVAVDVGEEVERKHGEKDGGTSRDSHVIALEWQGGNLTKDAAFNLQDGNLASNELDVSETEARRLFYSTEILRKFRGDDGPGQDADDGPPPSKEE